jgi:hypothetical protein
LDALFEAKKENREMNLSLNRFSLTTIFMMGTTLFVATLMVSTPAISQDKASAAKLPCIGCSEDGKTTPRMKDGHPDLSGYWGGGGNFAGQQFERSNDGSILFDFSTGFNGDKYDAQRPCTDADETPRCLDPNQPAYKPEYMAKVKAIAAVTYGNATASDPQMDCKPLGIPRTGLGGMEVVQGPNSLAILYESAPYSLYRIIYMDGRPHPADLDTSYMGHSIGHWEGDTLVVDVAGLSDETWLSPVGGRNRYTNIHSDKEHVIERWTRKGDELTYEATVEDPIMFTKPWVIAPRKVQHHGPSPSSNDGVLEQMCTIKDKDHFIVPTKDDSLGCSYRCSDPTKSK